MLSQIQKFKRKDYVRFLGFTYDMGLTNGEVYFVCNTMTHKGDPCVRIENDRGQYCWYSSKFFELYKPEDNDFEVGDVIKCVNSSGCTSICDNNNYTVSGIQGKSVNLQGFGNTTYKMSRFKLVTRSYNITVVSGSKARRFIAKEADMKFIQYVEVVFPRRNYEDASKQYVYRYTFDQCKEEALEVGDYVLVPDRRTDFQYAIARVVNTRVTRKGSVDIVMKLPYNVDRNVYLEELREKAEQLRNHYLMQKRTFDDHVDVVKRMNPEHLTNGNDLQLNILYRKLAETNDELQSITKELAEAEAEVNW